MTVIVLKITIPVIDFKYTKNKIEINPMKMPLMLKCIKVRINPIKMNV
jgi:hypothetical protein